MAVPGALVSRVPSWVTNAVVLAVCLALPGVSPLPSGLIRPVVSVEPDVVEPDVVDGDAEDVSDGDVPDEDADGVGDEVGDADEDDDEDGELLGSVVGDGVVPVGVPGAIGEGGVVGLDDEPGEEPGDEPGLDPPDPPDEPAGAGSHFWLVALLRACTVWGCVCARMAVNPSGVPGWPDTAAETMPKLEADTTRKPPAARLIAGRTCG